MMEPATIQTLLYAAQTGDIPSLKYALGHNTIDADESSGERTALVTAAQYRQQKSVEVLLAHGVDVNRRGTGKNTPLTMNAIYGDIPIARLLIEHGADVNAVNGRGDSAFLVTAGRGNIDFMKLLLENGVDINQKNAQGETALMKAAESGMPNAVKFLIENGADINLRDNKGKTALSFCRSTKHYVTVDGSSEVLQQALMSQTEAGKTPPFEYDLQISALVLITAAQEGDIDTIRYVLAAGLSPDAALVNGETALLAALDSREKDIVILLMDVGANFNLQSAADSPLTRAVRNGFVEGVRALTDRGADVNAANNFGSTPAHIAAEHGHALSLQALLAAGAKVNPRNRDGETPLMIAVRKNDLRISRMLIEHGADVVAKNDKGESVRQYAHAQNISPFIIDLLDKTISDWRYREKRQTLKGYASRSKSLKPKGP